MISDLNIILLLICTLSPYKCDDLSLNTKPRPNPKSLDTSISSLTPTISPTKTNHLDFKASTSAIVPASQVLTQICHTFSFKLNLSCPTQNDPSKICLISQTIDLCIPSVAKSPDLICQKQIFTLTFPSAISAIPDKILVPFSICIPGTITKKVINIFNNNNNEESSMDKQIHRNLLNQQPKASSITTEVSITSSAPTQPQDCKSFNLIVQVPCPTISDPDKLCFQLQALLLCHDLISSTIGLNCESILISAMTPSGQPFLMFQFFVCVPATQVKTITHIFNNNNNQVKIQKQALTHKDLHNL